MQPCPCYRAVLERCSSGLRGTPGKRVYSKRVSGVRISFSPQTEKENQRQVHLNADFLFPVCTAPPQAAGDVGAPATKSRREGGTRGRLREMSGRQRRNLGAKEARRVAFGRCRSTSERNPGEKEVRGAAYRRCRGDSERNLGEKEARGAADGLGRSSDDDLLNHRR